MAGYSVARPQADPGRKLYRIRAPVALARVRGQLVSRAEGLVGSVIAKLGRWRFPRARPVLLRIELADPEDMARLHGAPLVEIGRALADRGARPGSRVEVTIMEDAWR